MIKRTSESGAKYILLGGMSLRSNQKIRFLQLLKENWPEFIEKYEKLYGSSENPNRQYVVEINRTAFEFCRESDIPNYIPPPSFRGPLKKNFEVANLLLLIAYFKEMRAGNPSAAWAYHQAAQTIEELEENILEIHERDELKKIPRVGESLAKTITEFLDTGQCRKLERMKSIW